MCRWWFWRMAGIVFCLVVAMSVFLQHFSFEKTINGVRESVPLFWSTAQMKTMLPRRGL